MNYFLSRSRSSSASPLNVQYVPCHISVTQPIHPADLVRSSSLNSHYCSDRSPYIRLRKVILPYPRSTPVPAHGCDLLLLFLREHHNRSCSPHYHRSKANHPRTSKGCSPYHCRTNPTSPSHTLHSQTIPPHRSQETDNCKTYTFRCCKHSVHQSSPHRSSPSLLHRSDLKYRTPIA